MTKAESMKENGNKIPEKVMATRSITTKTSTLATSPRGKLMARGSTLGPMASTMKESGTMGRSMDLESGKDLTEKPMSVTGIKEKLME